MNKLKPLIGILLIFAVGALAGISGTRIYYKYKLDNLPEPLAYHRQMALKRMGNDLDLSVPQSKAIATIMAEGEQRILQLMAPHAREVDLIMSSTQARIMAELDADQQEKFLEQIHMIRQHRQPHMRMRFKMQVMEPMGRHGGPPPPRPFDEGRGMFPPEQP